jgi:hypothetical protein
VRVCAGGDVDREVAGRRTVHVKEKRIKGNNSGEEMRMKRREM